MKKVFLLLITIYFLPVNLLYATHIPGANITYSCDPSNPLEYTFTMTLFRKCPGTHPSTMAPTYFNLTNDCGLVNPVVPTFNQVGVAVDVNQLCSSVTSNCSGGTQPGVWKYIYEATIILPANCNGWHLSYDLCCRDASSNLTGATSNNMAMSTTLNTLHSPCNNSPVVTAAPIPYACTNTNFNYCLTTYDPEGDSMSFQLIAPATTGQAPITHLAGFSVAQPLNNFTLDPMTGCIALNHPTTGNFVVAILIREWDSNGNLLTEIVHDFQIMVVGCTNTPPTNPTGGISNFSGTGTQTGNNTVSACFGDQVCFDVVFQDNVDLTNNLTVTTDGTTLLPGATFTQTGTNPVVGTFCWTSQPGYQNDVITFIAYDDGCPVMGTTGFAVDFDITTGVYAGPDVTICGNQTATLQGFGASSYTWTPATSLSCVNCDAPVASPSSTTVYTVTGNLTGVCNNSDQVTVSVVPDFTPTASPSSATICANEAVQLNVSGPSNRGPFSFNWLPITALTDPTIGNPIATPMSTTLYAVDITSADGCNKNIQIPITVSGIGPSVTISPSDTSICQGDPVQLVSSAQINPVVCGLSAGCTGPISTVDIGTSTTSSTVYSPFYGSVTVGTDYTKKVQYIYTAAELNAMGYTGGTIQSIALFVTTSNNYMYDRVTIEMGCTTQDQFTNSSFTPITNMVQVFSNNNINPTNNGWHTFNITDYAWDGVSNLIIQICSQEDNLGNVGSESVRYTTTSPAYRCMYYYSTSNASCAQATGSRTTIRPNMRFSMCQQAVSSPSYTWTPSTSLNNSNTANPTATPANTSNYILNVTDSQSGCIGSAVATINVGDNFNLGVSAVNTNICYGSSTLLLATTSVAGNYSYQWAPAASLSDASISNPVATPSSTTTYFVTVTSNGSCQRYGSVTVNVSGNPLSVSASRDNICPGGSVVLNVTSVPQVCGLNPGGCSGLTNTADIGTATTSSISYGPFYGSYQDAKFQFLYSAADLTAMGLTAGTITEIAFNVATKSSTGAFNDFTISMGCSNATGLTTAAWESTAGVVYGPVNYSSTAGWNTFILSTPFDWDGQSNIVIETCFDNSSSVGSDAHYYTFTTGVNSLLRNYSNTLGPGCNLPPAYAYSYRPNVRFNICSASLPVGATFLWGPAADLNNVNIQSPTAIPLASSTYQVSVSDPANPTCPSSGTVTVNVQDIRVDITPAGPVNHCLGDPAVNLHAQLMVNGVATVAGSGICGLTFDETFDATTIPNSWTSSNSTANVSVNAQWKYGGNPNYGMAGTVENTGNGGNFAWVDGSSPYPIVVTLTSPAYPVATYSSLKFYMKRAVYASITSYNDFTVDVFDGATWNNAVFSHSTNTLASAWEQFTIPLTGFTMTGPVRFRFNVNKNGTPSPFYDDVAIDDIQLCQAILGSGYTWSPGTSLTSTSIQNPTANPTSNIQYQVESQHSGCTVTNTVDFNVGTLSTAPSMSPMPGSYCPNSTMSLTASGGTAGLGSTIEWYTGPNGTGTWLGSGSVYTATPASSGETYYIRREGGCNTTADDSVTIHLKNFVYGWNNAVSNNWCTDNSGWHHFFNGDDILLSLQGDLTGVPAGFPQITIMDNGTYYQQSQGPFTAPQCASSNLTPGEERFEMQRNWNVNIGSGIPSGSYNVRFYYPAAEKTAIESAAANWMATYPGCGYNYKYATALGFYWFKNTGSNYTAPDFDGLQLTASAGVTANGINYSEMTGVTSFSGGSGAIILSPSILLPVDWLSFDGETKANVNHLHWATVTEKNTDYFKVMRSKDGVEFSTIATVAAAANSTTIQNYEFEDEHPFTGLNYYKLALVDNDQGRSFSKTILLNILSDGQGYRFYPNPSYDVVYYQYESIRNDVLKIEVLDVLGKQVLSTQVLGTVGINTIPVDMRDFAAGTYMVKVMNTSNNTVHLQKIIKNKL
jgi:hypothetical protein